MAENTKIEKTKKFSLIELIMIIMLVGIVFTLIIPLRADKLNHTKLKEAVYNMQIIARADVQFKEDPANGYYIFEHTVVKLDNEDNYIGEDLLNIVSDLKTIEELEKIEELKKTEETDKREELKKTEETDKREDVFFFDYSVTDSTVIGTTNRNFGKEGASIYYYLPNGPWGVSNDKTSDSIFDPNWLP